MRKTIKVLFAALIMISVSSCGEYCAECTELVTDLEVEDFCGTNSEVKTYIEELEDLGDLSGLNWDCTKVKD
jgi:hypothetical protein